MAARPLLPEQESLDTGAAFGPAFGSQRPRNPSVVSERNAPPIARIPKPKPESNNATPTTSEKSEIWSAIYAVFNAVVNAVSVTHRFRAAFATGCFVAASTNAYLASFVPPLPSVSFTGVPGFAAKRPICAYVSCFVDSNVCPRIIFAKARASAPVSTK